MLNETNRNEVLTNLLVWISAVLEEQKRFSSLVAYPNVVGAE